MFPQWRQADGDESGPEMLDMPAVLAERMPGVVGVRLRYRPSCPLEVSLVFKINTGQRQEPSVKEIEWVLSREMLADGMVRPVGDGDVRIWPKGWGSSVSDEMRDSRGLAGILGCSPADVAVHMAAPDRRDPHPLTAPGEVESTMIRLQSEDGTAVITLRTDSIRVFLRASYWLVPSAEEDGHIESEMSKIYAFLAREG